MAEPVQNKNQAPAPGAKAAPKGVPGVAPKGGAPKGPVVPKAKAPAAKQSVKARLSPLGVTLGRSGVRQESALPYVKPKAKPAPKPAGKPAPKGAPAAKGAPVAKGAPPAKPAVKPAAKPAAKPVLKKAAPRPKKHYFIIENLCVGCGLCLDKCPPKINAIGYKFYGDVQEGGFRCYIDQDACISCSACFSGDECPSGALIEQLPDGEVLDFSYTPPERLDFDLRFLHRFHREAR
ncbi:MAG TPA: 4Fe-4S dicluster domain-containing protein [Chlorobaculum parvum]|uniref:4Fe-4S dicluster domain-containing protein n=1 Tax=Chlorobaculum parvum TaxID=274539 RepID=A0A7C5DIF3_9CHLB|nr:4Fe-4S dicluster domain-containing protein [Chlorobaculum parvum]